MIEQGTENLIEKRISNRKCRKEEGLSGKGTKQDEGRGTGRTTKVKKMGSANTLEQAA